MSDMHHKTIQITKQGLEELQAELAQLTDVKLPEAISRVAKAREHGDLSENAEYHNARDDQALIETRIDEIQAILNRAEVVAQTRSHTTIGVGSQIVVALKGKKATKTSYQIVGEYEADPSEGKISSVSPLGKALMGKKRGEEAIVKAPAGDVVYLVEEVK